MAPGSEVARVVHINEGDDILLEDDAVLPYRLIKNLGHGHSANVEMVEDTRTKAVYARKVFRICSTRDERRRIFDNEIKIIRHLDAHHHVIRVFATYVAKREVGLILSPVADGGDLESFLQDCRETWPLPPTRKSILTSAFGCLASGLTFMHNYGVRHKDIKPRNILMHQGSVIYTDFGYSLDHRLSGQSTTAGRPDTFTRKYSAPEVIEWEPRNSKSDVFSLGCVYLDILVTLDDKLTLPKDGRAYHEMSRDVYSLLTMSYHHEGDLIKSMLQPLPSERPSAKDVATYFARKSREYFCSRCETLSFSLREETSIELNSDQSNSLSTAKTKNSQSHSNFKPEEDHTVGSSEEHDSRAHSDRMRRYSAELRDLGYILIPDPDPAQLRVDDPTNNAPAVVGEPISASSPSHLNRAQRGRKSLRTMYTDGEADDEDSELESRGTADIVSKVPRSRFSQHAVGDTGDHWPDSSSNEVVSGQSHAFWEHYFDGLSNENTSKPMNATVPRRATSMPSDTKLSSQPPKHQPALVPIWDQEFQVLRCAICAWELEEGACAHCGLVYTESWQSVRTDVNEQDNVPRCPLCSWKVDNDGCSHCGLVTYNEDGQLIYDSNMADFGGINAIEEAAQDASGEDEFEDADTKSDSLTINSAHERTVDYQEDDLSLLMQRFIDHSIPGTNRPNSRPLPGHGRVIKKESLPTLHLTPRVYRP